MGIVKPRTDKIGTQSAKVKHLKAYAETLLPTVHGDFRCLVFKDDSDLEHIVMIKGEINSANSMLCRVHSECITSEVFGSLKCDCKAQLDAALGKIQKNKSGVLIYLRQEGRGIGLGNKIKAYALQEEGFDTVDANSALGLPVDSRDYELAANILKKLKVSSIRLLTNNPDKLESLKKSGIEVEREPLELESIPEQAKGYVSVKQNRLGHISH